MSTTPTLKANLSVVELTAVVVDGAGHRIPNLKKEDFLVYEDNVGQEIADFRSEVDEPISVGIVLDTSGSMVDKLDDVSDSVLHFTNLVNPRDDLFVMQFNSRPSLAQDFTGDRRRLRQAIKGLEAGGATCLYDAIMNSLQHLRTGQHEKKALLVITDGNDTSSLHSLRQAVDAAIRAEVPIYCLGLGHGEKGSFKHKADAFKDTIDDETLRAFSDPTGGRTFIVEGEHHKHGVDQIDLACEQVAAELRQRYILDYYPRRETGGTSYRQISVKTKNSALTVRSREGYFPSNGDGTAP